MLRTGRWAPTAKAGWGHLSGRWASLFGGRPTSEGAGGSSAELGRTSPAPFQEVRPFWGEPPYVLPGGHWLVPNGYSLWWSALLWGGGRMECQGEWAARAALCIPAGN